MTTRSATSRFLAVVLALVVLSGAAPAADEPFWHGVRDEVAWLAKRPTRVLGTPEHAATLAELAGRLRRAGPRVKVWEHPLRLLVPVVESAELRHGGRADRVYPLWPAGVRLHSTPEAGIGGRLVYVGEGEPGKGPGKLPARSLRGEIAVMELAGARHWADAYNVGARAILFLGRGDETIADLHTQLAPIPVHVPRYYLPPGDLADALRRGEIERGALHCRMRWAQVTATNLYALAPAAEPAAERAVCVAVPFDAGGVVPEQAPGADRAVDVALALRALEHFAENPPSRPILFAFIDAYAINQRGLREMLVALAADRAENPAKEHREEDNERLEKYLEHHRLASRIELTRESLNTVHRSRYRPLHQYVKDEVARGVITLEQSIQPLRLERHRLRRERNRLRAGRAAGKAKDGEDMSLEDVRARLEAVEAKIDALAARRSARYSAQEQLTTDTPVAGAPEALKLAVHVWLRVLERTRDQVDRISGRMRIYRTRDRIRDELIDALGVEADRPLSCLLALDLSDAGVAAGPCLRGRLLGWKETQNARPITRWLENADRRAAEEKSRGIEDDEERQKAERTSRQLWPAHLRRAVDLGAVASSDSLDSFVVGNLSLPSSPAPSFGLPATTWTTLDAQRLRVDTPWDRPDRLRWDRLGPQVDAAFVLLETLAHDAEFDPPTAGDHARKVHPKWSRVTGIIVDQATGEPVPRLPMGGHLCTLVPRGGWSGALTARFSPVAGVRRLEFTRNGLDGRFLFDAIPGQRQGAYRRYNLQAYRLAPDGRIIRAVDIQMEGMGVRLNTDLSSRRPQTVRAVTFPCQEVTVLGLFDTRFLLNLNSTDLLDAERASAPKRMNVSVYNSLLSCQFEPAIRWQLIVRAGLAGNRMALLNVAEPRRGVKTRYLMRGFPVGERLPEHPLRISARDFYRLDAKRLMEQADAGIANKAIQTLREPTAEQLRQAARAVDEDDAAGLVKSASGAMSNEVRAYQAVRSTANDVIRGAIFLLLMLVPFAYALERLLFAAPTVYRQLTGVIAIFAVMALVLWRYHPAFDISAQPLMIIMAFAVIFMSLMVISVIFSRFKTGLEELQSGQAESARARTSRLGLVTTAVRLGIANMRRRKFRTALTGATVILITFAMLCFMSSSRYRWQREFDIDVEKKARFPGVLIRQPNLQAMPAAALTHLERVVGGRHLVVPRYWWNNQSDDQWRIHVRSTKGSEPLSLPAALGLAPEEDRFSRVGRACPDWERFGAEGGCYLSPESAEKLGVEPGDQIVIAGRELVLVGTLNNEILNREIRQLDGDSILPLDYSRLNEDERRQLTGSGMRERMAQLAKGTSLEPNQEIPRVQADSIIILPASVLRQIPGSRLRTVAIRTGSTEEARELALDLAGRLAFPIYFGAEDGVRVLAATPPLPYAPKSLLIPVVIAGLIIFNTMLSSIAERKREIYIYTSLGLAPLHVGFLFLAEAVTYGLMGSIFGYVAGQGVASLFTELGWMGGLTLNYSGTQAILTMMLVLFVVVVSSLIPAFMAGKLATPSNEMRWTVPEPVDGVIRDKLPFTVTNTTANGVMQFLFDYLEAHREGSIGNFATDHLETFETEVEGTRLMGVECTAWLAPYDLGIRQKLRIEARSADVDHIFSLFIELRHQAGQINSWRKLNRVLLGEVRRQLLGWRKLKAERMLEYIAGAKERLSDTGEGAAT
ncbi:MAG: ABC transporter permease [Planctomycetota bacterium]